MPAPANSKRKRGQSDQGHFIARYFPSSLISVLIVFGRDCHGFDFMFLLCELIRRKLILQQRNLLPIASGSLFCNVILF